MIGDDVCTLPVLGREQGCEVPVSGQGGQHNNFAFLLLKSNLQNKQPNLSCGRVRAARVTPRPPAYLIRILADHLTK